MDLANIDDRARQVELLITAALGEVEEIADAKPMEYADRDCNFTRPYNAKRPFSLKDAKSRARCAAKYLREAWDLCAPPVHKV